MKNLKKLYPIITIMMLFGLLFIGCSDENNDTSGTSTIKLSLTDSPGDYEAVYIEVLDVKIKSTDNSDENDWVSIGNVNPQIYNLLDLTGGVTALLAENKIPSGYISQIRLILGDKNSVVINGVSNYLDTPSAQQSGLKLKLNETLVPNTVYAYLLDFDVAQSITKAGNSGKYILKPVLRLITQAVTGSIKGTVINANGYQVMATIAIPGAVVTTYTNTDGVFYLHGIPAGTYSVALTPDPLSGLNPKIIENVVVVNEQTTLIENISL